MLPAGIIVNVGYVGPLCRLANSNGSAQNVFFSGVAALGSLTLTVDWEGRLRTEMAAEANVEMEPLAAKAPAGQSRKPIVI